MIFHVHKKVADFIPLFSLLKLCVLVAAIHQSALGQAPLGNYLTFNGVNQAVIVTNFASIIPTNEITVEFWANCTRSAGQAAFLFNPDALSNRFSGIINYGTPPAVGLTYWDFGNVNGAGRLGPTAAPANSISNWVHYAFVASQSGNFMSVYTNGVLQTNKTGMTPFVHSNYSLYIGGGTASPFNGGIDDFRIWSVARSAAQIQANYNTPLVGNEPNLLLYYKFEGVGTVASNSATATGAAYDGTLTNNPAWVVAFTNSVVVTNLADSGPGTLRQVVSNALPGTLITISTNLAGQTILLTNGPIQLSYYLIIRPQNLSDRITLDGNGTSRIFTVTDNANVFLISLTFAHGNQNAGAGGAILNASGTLKVNNCTFTSNYADQGGAINNSATLSVNCSTFYGNQTDVFGTGGGIYNSGTMTMVNSTVFSNTVSGIYSTGLLNLTNCVVCGNVGNSEDGIPDNLYAPTLYQAYNLVDTDPMLAPFGNYGGPTFTLPPLPNSPAINAGADSTGLVADQRGLLRLFGSHVDIGAVELQALTLAATSLTGSSATLNGGIITNGLPISYYFAYGLTTNYTGYTATNSAPTTFVNAPITGLPPGTTHHFQLVVSNSSGTTSGGDLTFTTLPRPTVSSFGSQVSSTNPITGAVSVQLSAYVNSYGLGATVNFQYGLTTAYGGVSGPLTLPASMYASNMTVTINGLAPGNTFHWNVAVTNAGGTSLPVDQTFALAGPGGGSGIPGDINGDGIVSQSEFAIVYGIYATNSPWLYMTNVAGLGGTNVTFALSNSAAGSYTIQFSTNLVNWYPLGPATPRYLFTDTNAPANPQRYYRLVYP